jgi:hypothetical protein
MQLLVHYFLHFIFPIFIAVVFFKKDWKMVYLILLTTMLVDLDHLLVTPVFKANRCSIGFHYLHSYYAIMIYFLLLIFRNRLRIAGIGLLFHMLTDLLDCLFMFNRCNECYKAAPSYQILKTLSDLFGH